MTSTLRAVRLFEAGGPEVMQWVEVPTPEPGPGQIRVRHEAVGLNFIDIYQRSGLYPLSYPSGLGREGAGIVEAIGEGVTRFEIGDRAAYGTGATGAYAEAHVVEADHAVHVPEDVPLETAAAVMLKGMTAEFLANRVFHVKQGDPVLVHAAAGGVGLILCQWLNALGAVVIGTVGDDAKAELARANGCGHTILYRSEDIAGRVKDITNGKGVVVAYDSVGAATLEPSLNSLRRRGMLVSFGNASGPVPPIAPLRLSQGGSLFLTRPTLFDYVATVEELDASAEALFGMIASGRIRATIGQRFRLDQVRDAHEALAGRKTTGSTILIP